MVYMPPTAVMPETALVTAIRGECSECATPQTTWYLSIVNRGLGLTL